jgi:hypothetical protein
MRMVRQSWEVTASGEPRLGPVPLPRRRATVVGCTMASGEALPQYRMWYLTVTPSRPDVRTAPLEDAAHSHALRRHDGTERRGQDCRTDAGSLPAASVGMQRFIASRFACWPFLPVAGVWQRPFTRS